MSNQVDDIKTELEIANLAASFREMVEAKFASDGRFASAFDAAAQPNENEDLARDLYELDVHVAAMQVSALLGPKEDLVDACQSMAPLSIKVADTMARMASRVMADEQLSAFVPDELKQPEMKARLLARGAANLAKLCR